MAPHVLGDSNAYLDTGRVLVQHQVALAFIRERALNPKVLDIRWLDLACGRGQILTNVEHILSEARRHKVRYTGVDAVLEYARQAERRAQTLFRTVSVEICMLSRFERHLEDGDEFDVITFTNSAHELTPNDLAELFVASLCRLSDRGFLYLYDMERLPELELGAIPWEAEEIQEIFHIILRAAGIQHELPEAAVWPHASCSCWHFQIHRDHLDISRDLLLSQRQQMVDEAAKAIRSILEEKLLSTHSALQAASSQSSHSPDDRREVTRLLFDYWAVSRTLGRPLELMVTS